ncbi:MAG: hypothetical protein ACRCZS_28360 [Chroococcidiopsis sp.]
MAVNKNKSRSVLGDNPLTQGIFSKTEPESSPQTSSSNNQESRVNNQESTLKNKESRFLDKGEREAVNLRLPLELNDWLNELLKQGKRRHGSKIPKEVWVQAALELLKAMPVLWEEIDSEESLREVLKNIESSLKNIDFLPK